MTTTRRVIPIALSLAALAGIASLACTGAPEPTPEAEPVEKWSELIVRLMRGGVAGAGVEEPAEEDELLSSMALEF